MKKIAVILGIFFLSSINLLICEAQTIQWINHVGSSSFDAAPSAVCDKQGNIYLSGWFEGPICYFNTDTLYCKGVNDAFLIKFNANGEEQWVQQYGGPNIGNETTEFEILNSVYDSATNFLYQIGSFLGPVIICNDTFQTYQNDLFLFKSNINGECLWIRKYGGIGVDRSSGITLDKSGYIYICGTTDDNVNFGDYTIPPGGFIAKFDNQGNCIWAKQKFAFHPFTFSTVYNLGIRVSDSKIYVSGSTAIDDTIIIDTIKIIHKDHYSCIVTCFNDSGDAMWVREGISKGASTIAELVTDQYDNLYLTGSFLDTIYFGQDYLTTSTDKLEMFLTKYDKDGVFQWARKAGANEAEGYRVYTNKEGFVYVTGYFSGSASFDGFDITSYSTKDMFLARYNPQGICLGVVHFAKGKGSGITEDMQGSPVVTFLFNPSATLGENFYTSRGQDDILVFKIDAINGLKDEKTSGSNQLLIYANPNTGKCNITIPEEFSNEKELVLQIFDLQGKLIQQSKIGIADGKIKLDIQAQAKGMYTAVLSNGKRSYTGKIVFE